ncbi:MAG: hypothetical protein HYZ46_03470 [Nitrosomonadales bacterium]|nr:hypothetical protein [Nitrosomonadales bacterium]
MRYTSGVAPAVTPVAGDELKRVAGIRPVKPVGARPNTPGVTEQPAHQHPVPPLPEAEQHEAGRRAYLGTERRLIVRRIRHQPVLLELRSGMERRHHNLRDGDIVEHIDVQA